MKITIIGCGWLGLPLAIELKKMNYQVYGSTTNAEKKSLLDNLDIQTFLYDGDRHSDIPPICADSDICIITFPPSKSFNYSEQIQTLIQSFYISCKIIFTSSIGVYEDAEGEISESATCKFEHPVYLAEEIIRKQNNPFTFLRLAGLIGENRHPINYLSGKTVYDGNAPVNLVHQQDVLRAIIALLSQKNWGKTFNICNPNHPTKSEYYCNAAQKFSLEEPNYIPSNKNGKIVSGNLFQNELAFKYLFEI